LRLEETGTTNRKNRKALKTYEMHHPKADTDRLYLKQKEERRDLLQIAVTYKAEVTHISEYLNTKHAEDQYVNIVKSHDRSQPNMKLKQQQWLKWN
jgi:hypothetical protein